jgi:ribonuclease E
VLDEERNDNDTSTGADGATDSPASADSATPRAATRRRRSASRPAGPPTSSTPSASSAPAAAPSTPPASTVSHTDSGDAPAPAAKRTRKKAAPRAATETKRAEAAAAHDSAPAAEGSAPAAEGSAPAAEGSAPAAEGSAPAAEGSAPAAEGSSAPTRRRRKATAAPFDNQALSAADSPVAAGADAAVPVVLFQPPPAESAPRKRTQAAAPPDADKPAASGRAKADDTAGGDRNAAARDDSGSSGDASAADGGDDETGGAARPSRRRRGRRGRGGRGGGGGGGDNADGSSDSGDAGEDKSQAAGSDVASAASAASDGDDSRDDRGDDDDGSGTGAGTRRRRRRRRTGGGDGEGPELGPDDPPNTVVHVREPRKAAAVDDGVRGVKGSTRIEAKRQRRRDGRDTSRRRPSIITEAEFLARREAVDRIMVVRQGEERTQIAVLEDGVLVEHYVTRKDSASMVGNVYLGKVQNVLPSMEAAFVDIGRGRNAVLYAGEVNYDASALEGRPPRIEQALKSSQSVLVQVTKDPIGHKGGRLTSQVSLPGRYMVYVPDGRLSGISRKLPDTERSRLKGILKRLTPDDAGVIIRTAAEGASEEALERDLNRLKAQWEVIDTKSKTASAPSLIYGEPDLVIRVVRDIFNEDFTTLVVQGADEWDTIDNYVRWVAPDLADRTKRWAEDEDVFEAYRVDEQLAKALDRKVWLPSGGYLVIDRTEAMIVVDVNTGKFTGKGGNLEETVTKNNIEAAEEIVRQLRLRDLGGIIVIDFIDMVLESNRDLVLRRLLECLGRDRTRHQVAEVTSLGLVQMTRKRVGEGLLESFSETCKQCSGSGVILTIDPVADRRPPKPAQPSKRAQPSKSTASSSKATKRGGSGKAAASTEDGGSDQADGSTAKPSRKRRTPAKQTADGAAGADGAAAGDTSENADGRAELAERSERIEAERSEPVAATT